jgi:hypothetical protein
MPTLKEARETCGLTQSELANLAGVRTEEVIAWEADANKTPIDGLGRAWIVVGVAPNDVGRPGAQSTAPAHDDLAVAGCVVVAHEPQLWRWAMAATFRVIRPHLRVVDATPEDLDAAVAHHAPDFVVCSALTEVVQTCVPAWVWIDPADANRATIALGGQERTIAWLDFVDLVAVLDEAIRSNGAHERAGT